MSTLKSRFKYYGLGFGLGLVLVWATLLKDRDREAWLPEARTIEFLERTDIKVGELAKCQMECFDLPENFMDTTFWKNADIDFTKSATKRKPCPEYFISSTLSNTQQKIVAYIETCEVCENCDKGTATLKSIELPETETHCDCS